MTERCFYRISIKALIWNEDKTKFLVALEHNGQRDFLGGGLDHGEDPIDCIDRELREENGRKIIKINNKPYTLITTTCLNGPHKDKPIANIFYEIELKDTTMKHSDECVEVRFVTPQEALELPDRTGILHLFAQQLINQN